MKKYTFFLLLIFGTGCLDYADNTEEIFQQIRQLNQRMESLYEEGNPGKLAEFYTEKAIVFGPSDQLSGRSAIKKYWERIDSPVGLSLEILDLNVELDSLDFIQKNTKVKEEIPQAFVNQIDTATDHVFQLTKKTLSYEREDVTFFRSESISLINWEKQPEGPYRIKAVWLMQ